VSGALVTLEGVEGSGKTSQCRRLADDLRGRGLEVVETSEPDGVWLGTIVRGVFDRAGTPPTPLAQAFLFAAARHQHVTELIRPALERGAVVICDRYVDATTAYQGHAQGLDVQTIAELNTLATGGLLPDLTVVLDVDPAVGMARIHARPLDAFERMDLGFHRRVREGYLEIARGDKSRVVVIDGARPPDAVWADLRRAVEELLDRRGLGRGR
jgi:dTMP kinase